MGDRSGIVGTTGTGPRLLILGDSSAAGVGVSEQSLALSGQLLRALEAQGRAVAHWQLIARTGIGARELVELLDQVSAAGLAPQHGKQAVVQKRESLHFDLAVIAVGVNDVTAATPVAQWIGDLDRLHERLRRLGVQRAIYSGLPPMECFPALPQPLRLYLGLQARRYDRALAHWVAGRGDAVHRTVTQTDTSLLASDGFHPGEKGYALWAQQLVAPLTAPAPGARA